MVRKIFEKKSEKRLAGMKKGCTFAAVFDHTEEGKKRGEVESSLKA